MDMDKCCVVVIHHGDGGPPDAMTPQMVHALVRARETHIRYKSYVGTLLVQLSVTVILLLTSTDPRNLVIGVLSASLANAALYGLVARSWRRQFEKLSAP